MSRRRRRRPPHRRARRANAAGRLMRALERLELALDASVPGLPPKRLADSPRIEGARAAPDRWLLDRDLEAPPPAQVGEALEAFRQARRVRSRHHARLLCFGAAQPDAAGRRLIED